MATRILTVEEGVRIVNNLPMERRLSNALDLCKVQLQSILYSYPNQDADVRILGRALRRLGEWIRGVNKKGRFNLPLRAFEREILHLVSGVCEASLESLKGAVSGYRPKTLSRGGITAHAGASCARAYAASSISSAKAAHVAAC